jgi:hypothetical protein
LSIIDAQASGRRRLSPLLVLLAMHAFMEAGARRAKSRNALARKAAKREHRKAVFKQKRLENKVRKSALEKFNAERSERASLIEQGQLVEDKEAREELFPGSPVVAAGIYGEELRLLAKAGKVLKQFRAMKSNDVGTQALMMMVALTFKFSGRCMGRRRLQALRVMGAPPSDSLKHGAVKVLQVSWRLCMAKVKHRELKSQDKESMVPIAVALIQINWRVSLQTLERRRRRRAYKAERLAVASGKAASVVQKALRNRWDRAKIARVRNVFRGEILAFAAVKVQMAYRKNYMRRLQMIANGDEDDIEDIDDTKPPIFGVRTPKQAEGKLSILLAQHKNDLAQRIQALAEAKQALHRSSSTINSANKIKIAEELEKKRNDIRPISLTVLGCQQVPLPNGAMKDIMQSDLFFIVSALPSPPPAECLIGGENAPNAKRRGSATALMMNNTTVSNTEAKYQRGACFSMPAKAVHTSATERSKGAVDGINVVWKQEVALSGETLNGKSTLVFTLLRRPPKKSGVLTSSTGYRDEFIGQATIKLTDLPDLWSYDEASSSSAAGQAAGGGGGGQTTTSRNGREVTVDLNIGDLKCRVWDGKGNKLKVDRKEWNGAGKLRVSFLKQDDQSLFNGWMKVSTQSPNQMKTASLNDKTKSATTMEKRWVLLSNGRLSIHETYYIEPDIEIALETINGCRVDQQGFLYIDFDRVAASKIAIKRGRGNGTGGAGQGVAQGSFSFGTGPSSLKASVAVQSASTLTGVLMLAPGTGGNEVTALRKCIEKALFLRTHGN